MNARHKINRNWICNCGFRTSIIYSLRKARYITWRNFSKRDSRCYIFLSSSVIMWAQKKMIKDTYYVVNTKNGVFILNSWKCKLIRILLYKVRNRQPSDLLQSGMYSDNTWVPRMQVWTGKPVYTEKPQAAAERILNYWESRTEMRSISSKQTICKPLQSFY